MMDIFHAFSKAPSAETAVFSLSNNILMGAAASERSVLLLFHSKLAFDTICHHILP